MITVRRRLFAVLMAVSLASSVRAQNNVDALADAAPVERLMRELFALSNVKQLGSSKGQSLRSGEMAKAQMTSFGAVPEPDKIIMLKDNTAVVRIPAAGQRPDLYLYAARDAMGSWTWTSYRVLALTGMLEYLRKALREKPSLTATETITHRNLELTLSSDKQLITWFASHRHELDAIRMKVRSSQSINSRDRNADGAQLVQLGLSLAASQDGVVSITIGGMVDNEVGFLHALPGTVPEIDSSRYTWIEPLGGDWYLYKTT